MADVSIVSCPSYDPAACRQALLDALEPIGGLDFLKPGMRVGIKANLVSFMKPEAGGYHPPRAALGADEAPERAGRGQRGHR